MDCSNKELSYKDDFFSYEEAGEKYCFTKKECEEMYIYPVNHSNGKILNYEQYKNISDKLGRIAGKAVLYKTTKSVLDSFNPDDGKEVKFSQPTLDWLKYYTEGTYMFYHRYHNIPHNVFKELITCRYKEKYMLFRGITFGPKNIEYYRNFINGYKENKDVINNKSIKPVSTTTDIDVAYGFASNDFDGIVGRIDVDYDRVLVDLNIPNNFKGAYNEKEVILLPGNYDFHVISPISLLVIDRKLKDIEIFSKRFGRHLSFNKGYQVDGIPFKISGGAIITSSYKEGDSMYLILYIDTFSYTIRYKFIDETDYNNSEFKSVLAISMSKKTILMRRQFNDAGRIETEFTIEYTDYNIEEFCNTIYKDRKDIFSPQFELLETDK